MELAEIFSAKQERVKRIPLVRKRVSRIIGLVKDLVHPKDLEFLTQYESHLKNSYDFDPDCNKELLRKVVHQARTFRDTGLPYVINGHACDNEKVLQISTDILENSGNYLHPNESRFLADCKEQAEGSYHFTARQINWLENLDKKLREKILPMINGETFDIRLITHLSKADPRSLNCFARKRTLGFSNEGDYVQVLKDAFYVPGEGLNKLRQELGKYISSRKLFSPLKAYEPFIAAVEKFIKAQEARQGKA